MLVNNLDRVPNEWDRKTTKLIVTYPEYAIMMKELVRELSDYTFSDIYGFPRGGLPIAVHLSHHLKIPLIISGIGPNTLVVDDVLDTGETIHKIRKVFPEIQIATLFYKPGKDHFHIPPNFYLYTTNNWVVYPWEDPLD